MFRASASASILAGDCGSGLDLEALACELPEITDVFLVRAGMASVELVATADLEAGVSGDGIFAALGTAAAGGTAGFAGFDRAPYQKVATVETARNRTNQSFRFMGT
jgi:hypothetical protein